MVHFKGRERKCFPIPVFYIADLVEYQGIYGISASIQDGDSYPHPAYNVQCSMLGTDYSMEMPGKRTENEIEAILRDLRNKIIQGSPVSFNKVSKTSEGTSIENEIYTELKKKRSLDPILVFHPSKNKRIKYHLEENSQMKGMIGGLPLSTYLAQSPCSIP